MPRDERELRIQKRFIEWAWSHSHRWPDIAIKIPRRITMGGQVVEIMVPSVPFFHPPNGEIRDSRTGAKLNAQGTRKGIPDLFLPVPRGKHCGLVIEVKAPQGRVSKYQKTWIEFLEKMGWRTEVCRSVAECIDVTINYLDGK